MTVIDPTYPKRCFRCRETKPLSDFNRNRSRSDGYQPDCRACRQEQEKGRYKRPPRSPEAAFQRGLGPALKGKITLTEYHVLLMDQDGRCAVCRQEPPDNRRLAIDHCHGLGRIRGLLCDRCNRAIGALGDTAAGVRAALDYLVRAEGEGSE